MGDNPRRFQDHPLKTVEGVVKDGLTDSLRHNIKLNLSYFRNELLRTN